MLKLGGAVQALRLEDVGDVSAGEDDDRVAVFADFGVGLGVHVGGRDQDAELTVAEAGYQSADLPDADAVAGGVALGFQRELHGDGVGTGADEVFADCVASAVAPGPGEVNLVDARLAGSPQVGGE